MFILPRMRNWVIGVVLPLAALSGCQGSSGGSGGSAGSSASAGSAAAPGAASAVVAPSATASASAASPTASVAATPSAAASPSAAGPADAGASDDAGVAYLTYTNDRFHFTIDYPDFMTKNPAAANNAGQSFSFRSRASMRAWGAPNSSNMSVQALFEDWARRPGVLYKTQQDTWWIVSGKDRGRWYHSKSFLAGPNLVSVMIEYDDAIKESFEPVAKHIADSLKPSK